MERKYFVKSGWIFNLESMDDRLMCLIYDAEEGNLTFPVEIAGTVCRDEDDIYALKEECNRLEWTAKSGKVTGKEYGRIKEIVTWRVSARYARCLASGMSERDAGLCFEDM